MQPGVGKDFLEKKLSCNSQDNNEDDPDDQHPGNKCSNPLIKIKFFRFVLEVGYLQTIIQAKIDNNLYQHGKSGIQG